MKAEALFAVTIYNVENFFIEKEKAKIKQIFQLTDVSTIEKQSISHLAEKFLT